MDKTARETKHTSPKMVSGQGKMEKTTFGANRESNKGRGRFDLIPYEALEALAKWYEAGAEKYDERNWESGISVKDCINRMCRHAGKVASGWTDEDHLAAVMWNAAAAITMMQRKPECNDHTWWLHPTSPNVSNIYVGVDLANNEKKESNADEKPYRSTTTDWFDDTKKDIQIPEFMKRKINPPLYAYIPEEKDSIVTLRIKLDTLLVHKKNNGKLSMVEKIAMLDICTRILHMHAVCNDIISNDLKELCKKELNEVYGIGE